MAFAQGEANIWYFGENAGLYSNTVSPVALLDNHCFSWKLFRYNQLQSVQFSAGFL